VRKRLPNKKGRKRFIVTTGKTAEVSLFGFRGRERKEGGGNVRRHGGGTRGLQPICTFREKKKKARKRTKGEQGKREVRVGIGRLEGGMGNQEMRRR